MALGVFGGLALFFIGLPLAIIILPVLLVLICQPAVMGFIIVVVLVSFCLLHWRAVTVGIRDSGLILRDIGSIIRQKVSRIFPQIISPAYFFSVDGKDSGPHSLMEMRQFRASGILSDETLVVRLGDKEWQPAYMFTEFLPK